MLTPTQLKTTAPQQGINPYYQEKDYLQNIFLFNLFKKSKDFIFKGGTCLKIAYNYTRFSEDMDFNSTLEPEEVRKIVTGVLKSFNLDEREIFAEKIRALSMRGKPRDLFDLWVMINAGVEIEKDIVERKLLWKELKIKVPTEKEYERDLGNLLSVLPPYEQVVEDINENLIKLFE